MLSLQELGVYSRPCMEVCVRSECLDEPSKESSAYEVSISQQGPYSVPVVGVTQAKKAYLVLRSTKVSQIKV